MDEFKFQSILADDFLDFFLDYFPELKKQRVDSIPGEERSRPTASRRSWRVGSAFRSEGPVCPLGVALQGGSRAPRKDLRHPRFLSPIRPFCSPLPSGFPVSETQSDPEPCPGRWCPRGSPGRTGAAALPGEPVGGLLPECERGLWP